MSTQEKDQKDILGEKKFSLQEVNRRNFIQTVCRWLGWGSLSAFLGGFGLTTVKFLFPNVLYEPPNAFKAGKPDDYPIGVSEQWKEKFRVWVVRTDKGFYAFESRCTHLGCTPNWFGVENRFKCPCHGSNFNLQGEVVAGPAPEPLKRVEITLADDGQLYINKAKKENRAGVREKAPFFLSYA